MSGQMSDVIVINGEEFAIVEPAGDVLFDARSHGISPVMMHTANTRGVNARYRIENGQLLLSELQVGSIDAPPPLGDISATTDEYGQTWTYLEVDLPITWTGDLILGSGPIRELFVPSGFLPVWHYERVLAIDLEAGVVESTEDRTEQVAIFRAEKTGADAPVDDENAFERFLSSLKIRLGFDD